MSATLLRPAFIDGRRGKLFVLQSCPTGRDSGPCVLVVPPFAEEMNKSRQMLAMVARGLAMRAVATLTVDLYGTGDSAGEFGEGDWDTWLDDLERAIRWSASSGYTVTRLLAVRLGCILAGELATALPIPVERTVFWQPVLDGARYMTQFLRLRVAASLMDGSKETVESLRDQARRGEFLEVAGYELAPALVARVDGARLAPHLTTQLGMLHWMEIVRGAEDELPTASRQAILAASAQLPSIEVHTVAAEPFWSSTEIVRVPALVERTVHALAAAT